MRRARIVVAIGSIVALLGCRSAAPPKPAPPGVTVATPATQNVADFLDFTGNTVASNSVTVVARVEGFLEKIHFTDGAHVKKGDLLFTIQQDQYKAQLKQAEAQVLAQRASLKHATTELARYGDLVTKGAATQTSVDRYVYDKASAEAGL